MLLRLESVRGGYPFKNIERRVSENDDMLRYGTEEHYLLCGLSVLRNIDVAMREAGIVGTASRSILDLPCGHGRGTRAIRAAFPSAKIFVADLDRDGVDFCAEAFQATPIYSQPDFEKLNLDHKFDVIWVGSLVTHLPAAAVKNFYGFCVRHLSESGVAVVSNHGPFVAGRFTEGFLRNGDPYGIERRAAERMIYEYRANGFAYADYPDNDASIQHYGISLASQQWTEEAIIQAGGRMLSYNNHAFDWHHDVVNFVRK